MNKFSKAASTKAAPAKKPTSRWAGVSAQKTKSPIVSKGDYVFKHLRIEDKDDSMNVHLEVIEATGPEANAPGDQVVYLQMVNDKWNKGLGLLKGYVMALIGCPSEEAYDEFDPNFEFLDAMCGTFPEDDARAAELQEQLDELVTDKTIAGKVLRGNDVVDKKTGEKTGDYYREYIWTTNEASED